MSAPSDNRPSGPSLVVALVAAFMFLSPFTAWWAAVQPPWYVPYLMWLGVIALTALVRFGAGRHDL